MYSRHQHEGDFSEGVATVTLLFGKGNWDYLAVYLKARNEAYAVFW